MTMTSLPAFRGCHPGATFIVCGCGPSLRGLAGPGHFVTIGVNDVGRLLTPDYLVVVNPRSQFSGDRFRHVGQSGAKALFTQLDLGPVRPPVTRFRLGKYGGTDIDGSGDALHYTQNSPYVAVCLAAYMGAARIGLIGVDFTEHHFFAATGRHPLAGRLAQIDKEYGALAQALHARGVELVNLSPVSRLQSLRREKLEAFTAQAAHMAHMAHTMGPVEVPVSRPVAAQACAAEAAAAPAVAAAAAAVAAAAPRVFVVDYRFLSCGEVFGAGLRHAAAALGLAHAGAMWDDPALPAKVAAFRPDLLLVVHGRRFVQQWGDRFKAWRSAVWLTDEPYEVDDTAAWSGRFGMVFANDPATLARHRQAHYLPMAYDPALYFDPGQPRPHAAGFVGGGNPTRERCLLALAQAGALAYVVGGPWQAPALRRLALAANVAHEQTARLYQQTEIVINVFRDRHHFNRAGTPAWSMNPRIYEALACGALVVSQRRAEVAEVFPALPQFDTPQELLGTVQRLLGDRAELARLRADCRARLAGHAYQDRLARALALALGTPEPAGTGALPLHPPAAPHRADPPAALAKAMPGAAAAAAACAAVPAVAAQAVTPPARGPGPLTLPPLAGTPRRHLLYHLWPVRGGTWRWNVGQLLQRVELFNGRRVVAVACDARTEEVRQVREAFDGHGFEFIELANEPLGEAASFARLLERVRGEGRGDVSFYAHAKGVKYEPACPAPVRRWAEVQYAVALDHWPAVRAQLERFAMTGPLRRVGRYANHRCLGDWHYTGTFFWFRHDAVFERPWQEVPQFYGGVEAWPGVMFQREDTGCLLLDNLRELPYQERFWSQRGNPAYAQWRRALRPVPPPPGLAQPPAFEGHASPRLEQQGEEFAWWLAGLQQSQAQRLLVIGSPYGGVEWHVARSFAARGQAVEIVTLHAGAAPALQAALADARQRFGQALRQVDGGSGTPGIAAQLGGPFDAAFIDGDHGYAACRADVALARALGARQVALHDIVDSDWHAAARCCVSRVWAELQAAHAGAQACVRGSGGWGGIGLVPLH